MTIDSASYRCRPRKAGWSCPAPALITRAIVEPYVEEGFLAHAAGIGFVGQESTDARRGIEGTVEDARRALGELAAGPAVLEGELVELWPDLAVEERRHVLSSALGVVWVLRGRGAVAERVRLIARGSEPAGLPASGFQRSERFVLDWEGDLDGEIRVASAKDVESSGGTAAKGRDTHPPATP
jgi:hypothetical protein